MRHNVLKDCRARAKGMQVRDSQFITASGRLYTDKSTLRLASYYMKVEIGEIYYVSGGENVWRYKVKKKSRTLQGSNICDNQYKSSVKIIQWFLPTLQLKKILYFFQLKKSFMIGIYGFKVKITKFQ